MQSHNHRQDFFMALKSVNAHLQESMDMIQECAEEYKKNPENKYALSILKLFAISSSLNSMCVSLQAQLQEIIDINPKDVLS